MSSVFSEPTNLGDLVKYENNDLFYSRDTVTMAPNQVLPLGAVVGMITATQRVTALALAASDGSQIPCGILLHAVDTTLSGKTDALILARQSVVSDRCVVWPAGISASDKTTAISHLEIAGILIRQGA